MHDDIERRYSSRARSRAQLMSGCEFGCKDATFFGVHNGLHRLHYKNVVYHNAKIYLIEIQ